jgi:hypothetical protein
MAVAYNVTVTQPVVSGHLRVFPAAASPPLTPATPVTAAAPPEKIPARAGAPSNFRPGRLPAPPWSMAALGSRNLDATATSLADAALAASDGMAVRLSRPNRCRRDRLPVTPARRPRIPPAPPLRQA